MTQPVTALYRSENRSRVLLLGAAFASVVWAYWKTLGEAAEKWANDPQYSHGYLVPAFALALLWLRRHMLPGEGLRPNWWGAPLLAAAVVLRLVGGRYYYAWVDSISLLPCLAAVAVMMGGWPVLRWSWPAILFLVFMIPLPYTLEVMMAGPLQRMATVSSTFALQTLGLPALAEGNTILLNDARINIIEACSGLRMLVIFFALSTAVTLLIQRRLWEKILIGISAIPIALLVNVIRITVTGWLHNYYGKNIADAIFHDLAGWLMMPLALAILGIELVILKHLLVEPLPPSHARLGLPGLQGTFSPTRKAWKKPVEPQPQAVTADVS